ncbi:hypothetical protein QE152_g36658 [Popillia japonica]|uniref:Uncharacterized protein n=1 Tax=Popillia japonica TaxID=7064 RepID=A0AAW1ICL7_POPJA
MNRRRGQNVEMPRMAKKTEIKNLVKKMKRQANDGDKVWKVPGEQELEGAESLKRDLKHNGNGKELGNMSGGDVYGMAA